MEILDGKYTSSVMLQNLKTEIQKYIQQGKRAPRIDILLVGDDYASQMYVNMKEKKALDLFANLVLKIKKILQKYIPESRMLNVLIGAYLLKKEEFSDLEKELIDSLTNEEIKILNQIFVDN